jgi:hypothetical protein
MPSRKRGWSPVFRQKMRPLNKTRVLSGSPGPESTLGQHSNPPDGMERVFLFPIGRRCWGAGRSNLFCVNATGYHYGTAKGGALHA